MFEKRLNIFFKVFVTIIPETFNLEEAKTDLPNMKVKPNRKTR